jgi:hypothetical protein
LFDLALEAAARIAPPVLVLWCEEHIDEPGMAAGLAAAFRTTGHPDFAQLFLERAFAWQPERS